MRFEATSEIDLTVDDIIDEMDRDEKEEMFDALCDDLNKQPAKQEVKIVDELRKCSPYQFKKVLCDTLYVSSYCNEVELRMVLEHIIKAV